MLRVLDTFKNRCRFPASANPAVFGIQKTLVEAWTIGESTCINSPATYASTTIQTFLIISLSRVHHTGMAKYHVPFRQQHVKW